MGGRPMLTIGLACLAGAGLGILIMLKANPNAINMVIGLGVPGILFFVAGLWEL